VKHNDAQLVVGELRDGLDSCCGVEVASSIGLFYINFLKHDGLVGELASCCNYPAQ
jgi:hypothetical protein